MVSIIQLWRNRSKIAEGVLNSLFRKEDVEEVAAARMKVCESCPNIDPVGKSCGLPGSQPCCGLCGCSLKFKTRSISSSCDIEKWTAIASPEEEDEIYKEIKYNSED